MIPFSPPHIDDQIIAAVEKTLRSGWITTGPRTKEFEQKLAEYAKVSDVVCVNSATSGLELVLRWFGVKEGDEVIVPAYTYCATANVVLHVGAKPIMVDVGDDFNMDVDALETAITDHTKVIIPVDIAGWPCDYNRIMELVETDNIKSRFTPNNKKQEQLNRVLVLADAAHSIGAKYYGKSVGALADFSVFSFHAVKNLTTAEGGAVTINLPDSFDTKKISNQMHVSSLHGQTVDALAKTRGASWEYDVVEAGYKCNMPDILAAIGLVELARYDRDTLPKRHQIFEWYIDGFAGHEWALPPPYVNDLMRSSFHIYLLRINGCSETDRNRIIKKVKEQEVSVNVHFKPLPLLSIYRQLGYNISDYPKAFENYSSEITLPVYYDLTQDQVAQIIQAVVSSVESILNK